MLITREEVDREIANATLDKRQTMFVLGLIAEAVTLGILTSGPYNVTAAGRVVFDVLRTSGFSVDHDRCIQIVVNCRLCNPDDAEQFVQLLMGVQDGSALEWCKRRKELES